MLPYDSIMCSQICSVYHKTFDLFTFVLLFLVFLYLFYTSFVSNFCCLILLLHFCWTWLLLKEKLHEIGPTITSVIILWSVWQEIDSYISLPIFPDIGLTIKIKFIAFCRTRAIMIFLFWSCIDNTLWLLQTYFIFLYLDK